MFAISSRSLATANGTAFKIFYSDIYIYFIIFSLHFFCLYLELHFARWFAGLLGRQHVRSQYGMYTSFTRSMRILINHTSMYAFLYSAACRPCHNSNVRNQSPPTYLCAPSTSHSLFGRAPYELKYVDLMRPVFAKKKNRILDRHLGF